MNIGITGANGFLGSYFIDYLLTENIYNIKAFARNPIKSEKNIKWQIGNLSSQYDCELFVQDIDVIVHFAHNNNSPMISNNDIISDAGLNLLPNLTLLEAIKKSGKKIHIVYISSGGAIYGNSLNKIPFKEIDMCRPLSSYAIQKLTMENYLRLWSDLGYITATVLRVSNPYGVLLPSNRKQGLIGVVLNKLIHNETIQIFGNPNNIRDYIHLEDMSKSIKASFKPSSEFEIYNIGSGIGHSVNEILNLIEIYSGQTHKKEYIENKDVNNLIGWNILDISKAKKELNWQPEINLENGLQNLCNKIFEKE
ncbi:MAG: NAD-dependent epimerase/dehydratase, UDP-glucose 4-epimerase [Candidatus Peregrinibacteria bacterium GW2011_GWC2_33_13]|nr:MAG: NAD-dependent epimerase/dehydratase, UDP-glucose 4-epimerase [Candidatus Peregrinibacteria bacterium GW2011_GWC2_33_13]